MDDGLTAEQGIEVDAQILDCNILGAFVLIRRFLGCGINAAKDVHLVRYDRLRAERPDEFVCSHEAYWREVY